PEPPAATPDPTDPSPLRTPPPGRLHRDIRSCTTCQRDHAAAATCTRCRRASRPTRTGVDVPASHPTRIDPYPSLPDRPGPVAQPRRLASGLVWGPPST